MAANPRQNTLDAFTYAFAIKKTIGDGEVNDDDFGAALDALISLVQIVDIQERQIACLTFEADMDARRKALVVNDVPAEWRLVGEDFE